MNRVNYIQTGGFPMDTHNLDFLQNCFRLLNSLGDLAGDKAIISGCKITGNSISNGVVYLNGEVLEFRGGNIGANVIIKEEAVSGTFENGSFKPIEITRYLTFGSSTPDKTFAWADFKRFENLIENAKTHADFEKRIKALRGRFPLGWDPDDDEFNKLGKEDGDKVHTLTVEEMPSHSHESDIHASGDDSDSDGRGIAINTSNREITRHRKGVIRIEATGDNQPHNNMPPYRIIKYIEFIGFD